MDASCWILHLLVSDIGHLKALHAQNKQQQTQKRNYMDESDSLGTPSQKKACLPV